MLEFSSEEKNLDNSLFDNSLLEGQKIHGFGKYKGKDIVLTDKFSCRVRKILWCTYLLAWGGLVYEFIQSRMLSSRVNELQGKVDNLYQKVNNSKRSNEVLNRK